MGMIVSSARNATKPLHVHKVTVTHKLHGTDREKRLSFVNWHVHRAKVGEICPHQFCRAKKLDFIAADIRTLLMGPYGNKQSAIK